MWVIFVLEPAGLLGACKPGSQARMDSTTGGLAFSHFYGGPVKKTTLNEFYVLITHFQTFFVSSWVKPLHLAAHAIN